LLGCIFLLRELELSLAMVHHWSFDHELMEVAWQLPASKTDPAALGASRTWGCLCAVPSLPCPYHLAVVHLSWVTALATSLELDSDTLPLFPTVDGGFAAKSAVVATFEELAQQCGQAISSREGLRLFGGHTARVTGAQSLAAHGIEVAKIRILARHSGDTVLRYVSEAPLQAIRSDLGLASSSSAQISRGPWCGAGGRQSASATRAFVTLDAKLNTTLARVDVQQRKLEALAAVVSSSADRVLVQNLATSAIHSSRPGDGVHTLCGWSIAPERLKRGGIRFFSSLAGQPWWLYCERCLLPEREAAKLVASPGELPLSD
jgi:hypothetical protein